MVSKIKTLVNHSLFKEFSHLTLSTILFHISRVLVELYVARSVGPEVWGIWYILNLLLAYRTVFELGIVNAMNREVPFLNGKGESIRAKDVTNTSFTSLFILTLAVSIFILSVGFFLEDPDYRSKVFMLSILFVSSQFYYFTQTILKSQIQFKLFSLQQFLFAILFPVLAVPMSSYFALEGFMLAYSFTLFVGTLFIIYAGKIRLKVQLEKKLLVQLIKIGFPIMAVGITYTFLNTIDRWIISGFVGIEALGYYSLAIIVFGVINLLPRIISQQFYPRMIMEWGSEKSIQKLLSWTDKQKMIVGVIIYPIAIIIILLAPYLIRAWMPTYSEGIHAIQIIMIGPLFMPLSSGWGNVMNILNKQIYYLYNIIGAVLVNLALNLLFVHFGMGINGVALGTTIAFASYNISLMFTGKWAVRSYIFESQRIQ